MDGQSRMKIGATRLLSSLVRPKPLIGHSTTEGKSMVMGFVVEEDEIWAKRLKDRLRKDGEKRNGMVQKRIQFISARVSCAYHCRHSM